MLRFLCFWLTHFSLQMGVVVIHWEFCKERWSFISTYIWKWLVVCRKEACRELSLACIASERLRRPSIYLLTGMVYKFLAIHIYILPCFTM